MARKANKTQQDQANTQQEVNPENTEQDEVKTQPEAGQEKPSESENPSAKTKARMVDAVLKTRHCRGGNCKEAGDTMAMTQGEYDRLKKYDRVE